MSIHFQAVIAELVRALRGTRSQPALSRHLGFSTNVVHSWERGRRHPSVTQVLRLAEKSGVDVRSAFTSIYLVQPPDWLSEVGTFSDLDVLVRFLSDVRGRLPLVHLSELSGISRFSLARWLSGASEPRAWEFLAVFHHCTHRLVDFLAPFTSEPLASLRHEYQRVQAARQVAERWPLSQVLLRALEFEAYQEGDFDAPGQFSEQCGVTSQDVEQMLQLLEATGQVVRSGVRWQPLQASPLNMRVHKESAAMHRSFWASLARDHAPTSRAGLCAYNVCGVSRDGYEQLKRLQRDYLQKARALIEKSEPVERVALLQVNLLPLMEDHTQG